MVSISVILIFKKIFLRKLSKWSARTSTNIDDFIIATIDRSIVPLLFLTASYFAMGTLALNARAEKIIRVSFLIIATYFALRILTSLVRQLVFSLIRKQDDRATKEKQAKGLLIIGNIVIWAVGIVFLIDNLGYNVTTLVAGLGIGGIAIALAAQTILGDLFSYFVIFFDRPFEIGDFIIVEDKMGTVEYVGIKTTRIRTLGGEQLICSNTYLTNARVHNYKRMEQRRVVFKLGVVYQTSQERLKSIPAIIKKIIESKDEVAFDRGHFSGFGESSMDFEFVYYVGSPDYNLFMDKQQDIYFDIVTEFENRRIEFAYPTRTLVIQPSPGDFLP